MNIYLYIHMKDWKKKLYIILIDLLSNHYYMLFLTLKQKLI